MTEATPDGGLIRSSVGGGPLGADPHADPSSTLTPTPSDVLAEVERVLLANEWIQKAERQEGDDGQVGYCLVGASKAALTNLGVEFQQAAPYGYGSLLNRVLGYLSHGLAAHTPYRRGGRRSVPMYNDKDGREFSDILRRVHHAQRMAKQNGD